MKHILNILFIILVACFFLMCSYAMKEPNIPKETYWFMFFLWIALVATGLKIKTRND